MLMILELSQQFFEKYSNIKFKENSSSESRVVPCGQTDRQDEANSRCSQFCEHNYNLPQRYLSCSLSRKRPCEISESRPWNPFIPQSTEYQFAALHFVTYLKLDGFKRLTVSS